MRSRARDADPLRRSCTEVAPGLRLGGGASPLPAGCRQVMTLDDAAAPVTASGVVEVRHTFRDSRWEPAPRWVVDAAVAAGQSTSGTTLVRCRHRLNRSALVTGLVLRQRGLTAAAVVERLRAVRPGALTNPYFLDLLTTYPEEPQ
jgi:hypothetical protein